MGNEISAPKEEGPHVEFQERYFEEYRNLTNANPEIAKQDLVKWASVIDTILDLPIEEQSKYSDYVTNKICEMNQEIISSSAQSLIITLKWMIEHRMKAEATSIANSAKTILSITDENLKEQALSVFNDYLQVQREIRDTPTIKQQFDSLNPEDGNFDKNIAGMVSSMMKNITTQLDSGAPVEDIGRNFITEIAGPNLADELMIKIQIGLFVQEKINEGNTIRQSMRIAKEHFPNVPPDTSFEVKIKVNFDDFDRSDDEQSSE